jgi:hypothetical protein
VLIDNIGPPSILAHLLNGWTPNDVIIRQFRCSFKGTSGVNSSFHARLGQLSEQQQCTALNAAGAGPKSIRLKKKFHAGLGLRDLTCLSHLKCSFHNLEPPRLAQQKVEWLVLLPCRTC